MPSTPTRPASPPPSPRSGSAAYLSGYASGRELCDPRGRTVPDAPPPRGPAAPSRSRDACGLPAVLFQETGLLA
jgi:hypothetical protein